MKHPIKNDIRLRNNIKTEGYLLVGQENIFVGGANTFIVDDDDKILRDDDDKLLSATA